LSANVCEKIIELLGQHILKRIGIEIKETKYFSISVDSTPDISHIDQLTVTDGYVSSKGFPKECFLQFIPILSHTGESLATATLSAAEKCGLTFADCRSQSYDKPATWLEPTMITKPYSLKVYLGCIYTLHSTFS
jgi:hypothetical protein